MVGGDGVVDVDEFQLLNVFGSRLVIAEIEIRFDCVLKGLDVVAKGLGVYCGEYLLPLLFPVKLS